MKFLFYEVVVNFNMFNSIMLYRIVYYANCRLVITIKLHKDFNVSLAQVKLVSAIPSYTMSHSLILHLCIATGYNTLFLASPSD